MVRVADRLAAALDDPVVEAHLKVREPQVRRHFVTGRDPVPSAARADDGAVTDGDADGDGFTARVTLPSASRPAPRRPRPARDVADTWLGDTSRATVVAAPVS